MELPVARASTLSTGLGRRAVAGRVISEVRAGRLRLACAGADAGRRYRFRGWGRISDWVHRRPGALSGLALLAAVDSRALRASGRLVGFGRLPGALSGHVGLVLLEN